MTECHTESEVEKNYWTQVLALYLEGDDVVAEAIRNDDVAVEVRPARIHQGVAVQVKCESKIFQNQDINSYAQGF